MAECLGGASGPGLAAPAADATDGAEKADNYVQYAILGAGIAGLSAASHLAQKGVRDFRVLEARNRLGGRIITMQIGGAKAELGASWIHGVLGNPLYELAVSKGLLEIVQNQKPRNVAAVTEDGRRLPFSVLQEIYEAYFWFFKRCEEYFLCKYQPPAGVNSVGAHIELEISIYLQRFPPQQRHLRRLVFDYLLKRETCITGCDSMNEIDLLGIGSYTELPGGNITLPHGYASILQPIISTIPSENILKQHAVKHIHWKYRVEMENLRNDKGYESEDEDAAKSTDSGGSVKTVKDANEETEGESKAESELPDEVIGGAIPRPNNRARSSSVASSVQSSCAPSICNTPLHRRAYPNVMIECENGEKFYTDHVICTIPLGIVRDKTDLFVPPLPQEKLTALSKLNYGTVDKIFLEYDRPFLSPEITEVILLWDHVDEKKVEMKDRWFRKIYSFCKISETVIVGWISGEEAEFMETLKMTVVAETCTAILKKFLADPYVPKPKSCVFTAWHSQPYTRGSYSSIGVGGQQADIEKVAEPLFQRPMNRTPVVAFAGEHCHPSFYSTGHGAYLSGRTAAQFFLNAAAKAAAANNPAETVYNLGAASVADLSTWLEEVSLGEKNLEDYRSSIKAKTAENRPKRDDGKFVTPR